VLINITGGPDMTLYEVDEAANRIREEVDPDANIIFGSTFDESLEGRIRISVIATGIDAEAMAEPKPTVINLVDRRPAPRPTMAPLAAHSGPSMTMPSFAAPTMAAPTMSAPAMQVQPSMAPIMTATATQMEPSFAAPAPVEAAPAPMAAAPMTADGRKAFIPGMPVEPTATARASQATAAARPFAEAAMVNAGHNQRAAKVSKPSLFERVTGTGRARDTAQEAARPSEPPALRTAPQMAAPQPMMAQPAHATEPVQVAMAALAAAQTPAPMPAPQPVPALAPSAQTSLGLGLGVDPADKPKAASMDDDLLDIPAFLRRQAN
jgi:cell division protein FtsZ